MAHSGGGYCGLPEAGNPVSTDASRDDPLRYAGHTYGGPQGQGHVLPQIARGSVGYGEHSYHDAGALAEQYRGAAALAKLAGRRPSSTSPKYAGLLQSVRQGRGAFEGGETGGSARHAGVQRSTYDSAFPSFPAYNSGARHDAYQPVYSSHAQHHVLNVQERPQPSQRAPFTGASLGDAAGLYALARTGAAAASAERERYGQTSLQLNYTSTELNKDVYSTGGRDGLAGNTVDSAQYGDRAGHLSRLHEYAHPAHLAWAAPRDLPVSGFSALELARAQANSHETARAQPKPAYPSPRQSTVVTAPMSFSGYAGGLNALASAGGSFASYVSSSSAAQGSSPNRQPDQAPEPIRRAQSQSPQPAAPSLLDVGREADALAGPGEREAIYEALRSWHVGALSADNPQIVWWDPSRKKPYLSARAAAIALLESVALRRFRPTPTPPTPTEPIRSAAPAPQPASSSPAPRAAPPAQPAPLPLNHTTTSGDSKVGAEVAAPRPQPKSARKAAAPAMRVGPVTVLSPGRVDPHRPQYHCETEIWPIGFKAVRLMYSNVLKQTVCLMFDILDGGDKGPQFRITLDLGRGGERKVITGRHASKPWKDAFERIGQAEREALEQREVRRRRRRERAARTMLGFDPATVDAEERILRKRIGNLCEERALLQHGIVKDRVRALSELDKLSERTDVSRGQGRGEEVDNYSVDPHTFFTHDIVRLIEEMPDACLCSGYQRLDIREAELELSPPPSPQPSPSQPPPSPDMQVIRRTDSEHGVGRPMKQEDSASLGVLGHCRVEEESEKRRRKEEEKKLREAASRQSKEAEKVERRMRQVEEKRRRERRKEMEKELRRLRHRLDADVQRRRAAVRLNLQFKVDQESLEMPVADGQVLQDDTALGGFDDPLPASTYSHFTLPSELMGSAVQVWDALYTFAGRLGMDQVPSLKLLLGAIECADRASKKQPTAQEKRQIALLDDLALTIMQLLVPDTLKLLSGNPNPAFAANLPLCKNTWPEIARCFLVGTFYRNISLDPATLTTSLRGRGQDCHMDAADRRGLTLSRLRLLRPTRSSGDTKASAFTVCIVVPNPLMSSPWSWQASIEALRLFPPHAHELVAGQLGLALEGLKHWSDDTISGVTTALDSARDMLETRRDEGVQDAVATALAALETYQAYMREATGRKEDEEKGHLSPVKDEFADVKFEQPPPVPRPPNLGRESTGASSTANGEVLVTPTPLKRELSTRSMESCDSAGGAQADSGTESVAPPQTDRSGAESDTTGLHGSPDAGGQSLIKEMVGVTVDVGKDELSDEDEEEEEERKPAVVGGWERDVDPSEVDRQPDTIRRCYKVLLALMASKAGQSFKQNPRQYEGYINVVLHPLGLMDIARSLAEGLYNDSVGRFAADVRHVVVNCAVFNVETSEFVQLAEKLAARFERLLLSWVLDPAAPPIDSLGLDDCCLVCDDTTPEYGYDQKGEWKVLPLLTCVRCEASYHLKCSDTPEPSKAGEYWFCDACVMERSLRDVDPYMRLRVVKRFSQLGVFEGRVTQVRYTKTGAVYTVRFRNGKQRFKDEMTRGELYALAEAQGLTDQPELAYLLRRPPEMDVKAEFEAVGHLGWGLGTLVDGERSLPRKMDPELSYVAKRWAEEDLDMAEIQRAVKALDVQHKSAGDWLSCLCALVGQVAGAGAVEVDEDLKATVAQAVERDADGDDVTLPAELMPGAMRKVKLTEVQKGDARWADEEGDGEEEEGGKAQARERIKEEEDEIEEDDDEMVIDDEDEEDEEHDDDIEVTDSDAGDSDHMSEPEGLIESEGEGDEWEEPPLPSRPSSRAQAGAVKPESPRADSSDQAAESSESQPSAESLPTQPPPSPPDSADLSQEMVKMEIAECTPSEEGGALPQPSEAAAAVKPKPDVKAEMPSSEGVSQQEATVPQDGSQVLPEVPGRVKEVRQARELKLFEELLLAEAGRVFGEDGVKLVKELRKESSAGLPFEMDAEGGCAMTMDDTPRPSCAFCGEHDRYLCSVLVYGPSLADYNHLPATVKAAAKRGQVDRLIWLPADPRCALQEEQLCQHLNVPLRRGGLVMHQCCAEAVVEARAAAEQKAWQREQKTAVESVALMGRGRTCALGTDRRGRFYWQFAAQPELLFVQPSSRNGQVEVAQQAFKSEHASSSREEDSRWVVYDGPEEIARLLLYLHPHGVKESALCRAILRQFPEARQAFVMLQGEGVVRVDLSIISAKKAEHGGETAIELVNESEAVVGKDVVEGEEVLVRKGEHLWGATVMCIGQRDAMRVRYSGWSERCDEWVQRNAIDADNRAVVVKSTPATRQEMEAEWCDYHSRKQEQYAPPTGAVENLQAYKYMCHSNRNRSRARPTYELKREENDLLYEIKCAMLTFEAALPLGCMYDAPDERHAAVKLRREELPQWVKKVENATTAAELMEALILLENSIDTAWRRSEAREMYLQCLPAMSFALKYASVQSLALRVWTLDLLIDYSKVVTETDYRKRMDKKSASRPKTEYLPTPKPSTSSTRKRPCDALPPLPQPMSNKRGRRVSY